MNFKSITFSFVLFFFLLCNVQKGQAQFPVPMISAEDIAVPFVNKDGSIAFELPLYDRPIAKNGSYYYGQSGQRIKTFHDGYSAIKSKDSHYWVDKKGKTISSSSDYYLVRQVSDKYHLAVLKKENEQNQAFCFLHTNGKRAFQGTLFHKAKDFREGLAAVQFSKGGEWAYIDTTGKIAVKPKVEPEEIVEDIESFKNGYATISIQNPIDKFDKKFRKIIDRTGVVVLDINTVTDRYISSVIALQNGNFIIVLSTNTSKKDLLIVDKNGDKINFLKHIYFVTDFKNGHVIIMGKGKNALGEYENVFYKIDGNGTLLKHELLKVPEPKITNINSNYVSVGFYKGKTYRFNTQTGEELIKTSNSINALEYPYCIVMNTQLQKNKIQLLNLEEGSILWENPMQQWLFYDFKDALKNKNNVGRFNTAMNDQLDFQKDILQLENLEILELQRNVLSEIPDEVTKLKKLKKLELSFCKNLVHLSKKIASLPSLQEIHIENCPKISKLDLHYILQNAKGLTYVSLPEELVDRDFIAKIKRQKPKLILEIEEELEMDETLDFSID